MHVILGTGPLGMSIMRELMDQGERVRMISYSGNAVLPPNVQNEKADLLDAKEAAKIMKGATVIYHCAQPAYHQWGKLFMRMQDNIVSGAMAAGVRLVVAENLYMYGLVQGKMHEQLPHAATTRKGVLRSEMSRKLLKLHQDGLLQVVIGRGSDFFGPGVLGSAVGERFFKPIVAGKPCTVLGDPDKKHSYTFIHDFGKALVALGRQEDTYGQAWHVPNADAVTMRQFAEMAYRAAGYPASVRTMGRGMLRIGGLFIPEARETIEMMYQFEHDFVVDHSKFSARFELPATPLEHAVAQTLEWFQSQNPKAVR
jgi:nucleoside-diphosphate-sugar epimerase